MIYFLFAFPDDDFSKFDPEGDEYFLGPIVTFKNSDNKLEIIDGQQRLTTLMLLLRAFYSFFGNMKDDNSKKQQRTYLNVSGKLMSSELQIQTN